MMQVTVARNEDGTVTVTRVRNKGGSKRRMRTWMQWRGLNPNEVDYTRNHIFLTQEQFEVARRTEHDQLLPLDLGSIDA